ncbi:MAG: 50S ribosomal protein L3 N(5)-glutamine methyltransferase [Betaproteobacteria bacterium]|nr:50S ribosomal protein L3 N(5)-glutamine methyltransferase [Betaproteobacteria bacterium]
MARTVPAKGVTVRSLVLAAAGRLESAGVSFGHGTTNAVDEAAWLVLHSLGLPVDRLDPYLDVAVDAGRAKAANALVAKRIRTRKPAAYLLNEAWLGPHRFYVDERVIVPRSFIAELLRVRLAPWIADPSRVRSALDLCTGSGCLAILTALAFPKARVDAADLSPDALVVAGTNVEGYRLGKRVHLVQSDLFGSLEGRAYDLIVTNPPYVTAASMRRLPEEYRREPEMALASGADGLAHTRVILAKAGKHLNPGGTLVVEIGHNRKALERAFPKLPFAWPTVAAGTGFVFVLKRESLPAPGDCPHFRDNGGHADKRNRPRSG